MKLLLFLLSTILTRTSVNSNNIVSCSDKLDRFECIDTYYCGWCNTSKLNVTSYGNVCKQITNTLVVKSCDDRIIKITRRNTDSPRCLIFCSSPQKYILFGSKLRSRESSTWKW